MKKKNKPLFSEGTLNLIGKNIESSSLALNNPQLFYRNYFNKVVSDDNHEKKKNFSSKLKEMKLKRLFIVKNLEEILKIFLILI